MGTMERIEGTGGSRLGFWQEKEPCWEMCHCPDNIKNECPAPVYADYPCWEIEGTYLKLSDDRQKGCDTRFCQLCRVYKRYGTGRPIELRLLGRGIDADMRNLDSRTMNLPWGNGRSDARNGRTE
jgi:hypothetical protein